MEVIKSTLTDQEIQGDLGVNNTKWGEWEKILPHSHVTLLSNDILVIGIRR